MVLLLSTYDLGRQPFGLASPAAWLRRAGIEVEAVDLSRQPLDAGLVARAALVAVYLPMHTATRLALPVIRRIGAINAAATICAYGLYAPLNRDLLRESGAHEILGPEYEEDLVTLARRVAERPDGPVGAVGSAMAGSARPAGLPRPARLAFIRPDRRGLPPPARYATLQMPDGSRRMVGSTDATRGCLHRCRHCPIVPVYDGRLHVVPTEVVLADIRAQVETGVEHITFADPDFLNGPAHARRIVEAMHAEWPALSYDATVKVEHLIEHVDLLPVLAATGCLFVTSAVESVDDRVLDRLEKGHTRADFAMVTAACRAAGLTLVPTFVAFTPWTTLEGYRDLLDTVDALELVDHVAPVQWSIRLLITWQSRLLELPDVRALAGDFDRRSLTHPWRHPDPRVDRLHASVIAEVGTSQRRSRAEVFDAVRRHLDELTGVAVSAPQPPRSSRSTIPFLDEPWYC